MKRVNIWRKISGGKITIICVTARIRKRSRRQSASKRLNIKDADGNIMQIEHLHSFSQKFRPLSSLDKKAGSQ